jgi:hypothetical protein
MPARSAFLLRWLTRATLEPFELRFPFALLIENAQTHPYEHGLAGASFQLTIPEKSDIRTGV